MEIKLTNGDLITLRDPKNIKERHRRVIEGAYLEIDDSTYAEIVAAAAEDRAPRKGNDRMTAEDMAFMARINDVCIVALIDTWKRGETDVAPTEDNLQDLDAQSYADLGGATAPLIAGIRLEFDPTPQGIDSPTVPVSG